MQRSRYVGQELGLGGMVAAAHPLAVLAGIDALREGGTAMDACLCMASVTSVVLPQMCGLGGDVFFLYYDAGKGRAYAYNGSGAPGDLATPDFYEGKGPILPQDGIHSVGVPGAPMGYQTAAREFGTLGLHRCFEVGADIAERGFVVSPSFSAAVAASRSKLLRFEEASRLFLPGGQVPRPGELFRQPELAHSLREFGQGRAAWAYKGPFADGFMEMNEALGGRFLGGEFARHMDQDLGLYEPLQATYRGFHVLETAPVSQGFLVLTQLCILENFDLPSLSPLDKDYIHLMVEAKKIAFALRNRCAGDPLATGFDASPYISWEYVRGASSEIDPERASSLQGGVEGPGDTASFVAWDGYGNACSFIHSIAFAFGSGLVVPGTGVLLNNRVGRSFVLEPGHPNCLAPGKRPMHTLNAYMVMSDGAPYIVGGTPGGDGQPQWNAHMLSLMLDHGYGPDEAAQFPRWTSHPGTDVIGLGRPPMITMERRYPEATMEALTAMRHKVVKVGPFSGGGGAQIIMKDPSTGVLVGGSDRRAQGLALGY